MGMKKKKEAVVPISVMCIGLFVMGFLCWFGGAYTVDRQVFDNSVEDVSINVYLDRNCEWKDVELVNDSNDSFSLCPVDMVAVSVSCDCHKWGCALSCFECVSKEEAQKRDIDYLIEGLKGGQ